MPKPKARACLSTPYEHGSATLGNGTQSVRTRQDKADKEVEQRHAVSLQRSGMDPVNHDGPAKHNPRP